MGKYTDDNGMEDKMREYKEKEISLDGDRKQINAVKKAGIETYNPKGPWNGYGYERLPMVAVIISLSDMRKFNKIKKELENSERKPALTEEEKKQKWIRRLAKLADITEQEAEEIANEKLEAKQKEIVFLEERQEKNYSVKRETLIRKIERSNQLRYIKDSKHANNIMKAHRRHSDTDYDNILSELHELEEDGRIEKGNAKELARDLIKGKIEWNDIY